MYEVGQKVRALKSLYDAPDGDSPGGCLCQVNEVLIIRDVKLDSKFWPLHISHEHITNNSFGVKLDEVELIE